MKLRVGIVGLGPQWESRYLPALRALADRFEVRGICEQVAHLAQRAAAEIGAAPVDGFRALAARDDIDAILYLSMARRRSSLPVIVARRSIRLARCHLIQMTPTCCDDASRNQASPLWPNCHGGMPRPPSGSRS